MSETTQFFFLIPLPIEDVVSDGIDCVYSLDEKTSPLINALKKTTSTNSSVDAYLLKTIRFDERYNYANKLTELDENDPETWIMKTLPKEYVDAYSPYCCYPLLICFKKSPDSLVGHIIVSPNNETDYFIHLLILFIQYIQLQNPCCELLNYLDKMTKHGRYVESSRNGVQPPKKNSLTRSLRSGCCFGNLFVKRNGKVGVLSHRPCQTEDRDLLKRIIKQWIE